MRKIAIVGNSGAGKSTLARNIGITLGIEVLVVDKIYWLPGWVLREHASFRAIHDQWLSFDAWIIDGIGYWEEMVSRLKAADLVVFLDAPIERCKAQALKRISDEQEAANSFVTEGCVYGEVVDLQMRVIDAFDTELRPKLIDLLSQLPSEKVQIVSNSEQLKLKSFS